MSRSQRLTRPRLIRATLEQVLRDSPAPLSTTALIDLAPRSRELVTRSWRLDCEEEHRYWRRHHRAELLECRGPAEHFVAFAAMWGEVYNQLRNLENAGTIERIRVKHDPNAYWSSRAVALIHPGEDSFPLPVAPVDLDALVAGFGGVR